MTTQAETVSRRTKKEDNEDKMDLNILLKFIKPFDGSREKLIPFLNNCGNAYDLASDSKRSVLLKYILSQLEGKAKSACAIKEFESWEQLSEFLNTQLEEKKHYSALLSDLQNCNQNNDSVNEFALRVESCLSKLLTEGNPNPKALLHGCHIINQRDDIMTRSSVSTITKCPTKSYASAAKFGLRNSTIYTNTQHSTTTSSNSKDTPTVFEVTSNAIKRSLPYVLLQTNVSEIPIKFLIDSGSEATKTLGQFPLKFFLSNKQNISFDFHAVDDVNLPYDAIIGNDFLNDLEGIIDYNQNLLTLKNDEIKIDFYNPVYVIPPRSESIIECSVSNPNVKEGLVLDQHFHEDLIFANCLVSVKNNKRINISVLNISEAPVTLKSNLDITLNPLDFDDMIHESVNFNSTLQHIQHTDAYTRTQEVLNQLRVNHLNTEESNALHDFNIITDHRPLVWLMNHKDPSSKLQRWRLKLSEYDYNIIYPKGRLNSAADALSRYPVNPIQSDGSPSNLDEISPFNPDHLVDFEPLSPDGIIPSEIINPDPMPDQRQAESPIDAQRVLDDLIQLEDLHSPNLQNNPILSELLTPNKSHSNSSSPNIIPSSNHDYNTFLKAFSKDANKCVFRNKDIENPDNTSSNSETPHPQPRLRME
ncbi:unnamed protein product [Pieris brassicae]|uniref:Reverse transcriptase RNase H-like domain-containing protein n=1 Tax=Pieris brassicae TaxID=7116 RepID=A0A9P0XIU1_PIEBR|nr:unnamed protein product [Pieris brassicae]